MQRITRFIAHGLLLTTFAWADEARSQSIAELPDLFRLSDGQVVNRPADWDRRREELKRLIQHYEYGHLPPRPDMVMAEDVVTRDYSSIGAHEERLTLVIGSQAKLRMRVAVYRPRSANGETRLPVIIREEHELGHVEEVPLVVNRNYMFIEFAREDLAPDSADAPSTARAVYPDYDWATLAVWAWGALRVVDYLESRDDTDVSRIGLVGHSRGGKMALLAGALDERLALVAANGSGCGGAGCFRVGGQGVETLELITRPDRFGYWFHPRLREFANREHELPIDQHFLKALVAPRALLCTEALEDTWANPTGTRATSRAAQPVFEFLGEAENNGLHFRPGRHDLTERDWQAILDFADWHFRDRRPADVHRFQQFQEGAE